MKTISISKNETIKISNPTFGDITILLNDVGEYVIVSEGPPITVQQTTLNTGLKQEYVGNSNQIKQTALTGIKVNGDLILGNITQSIR